MTQDEKNLKIAEWLEPEPLWTPPRKARAYLGMFYSDGGCWQRRYELGEAGPVKPRDFFTDESANALVLEKMPAPTVRRRKEGWLCRPTEDVTSVVNEDRKTAICEAALRLIEGT